jgi:hypothetical protein
MKGCYTKLHRTPGLRRDCASDPVGDVDPMRVKVQIDNHSDVPMEHWRENLRRQRRQPEPAPATPGTPAPGHRPPSEGLIDEYAAPI